MSVATFAYDALGRRIEKVDTIAGTTARFYYDDQRIVLQDGWHLQAPGLWVEDDSRTFVFGNYIDEVLVMSVIPAQAGIQDYYYAHDHLYSPVALFESDGDLVERYEYDVYGSCRILTSGFSLLTSSQYGNSYAFTGRELDSFDSNALKIMYYRARSYDPQTGRFLQRDPLQYIDGMSLYEYVKSNPANNNDPLGNEKIICQGIVLKRNHVKWFAIIGLKEGDGYGHWWTLLSDTESYGWWPKEHVGLLGTFFSVEGILNGVGFFVGGTPTMDPHHGWIPDEIIYPSIDTSWFGGKLKYGKSKGTKCTCADCDGIKDCARDFAKSYKGRWSYPFGSNCHSFQKELINSCCLQD